MTNRELKRLRFVKGKEREHLLEWIAKIQDPITRQIFVLRFVHCLGWEKVADKMGGMNTGEGCRKRMYRELERPSE